MIHISFQQASSPLITSWQSERKKKDKRKEEKHEQEKETEQQWQCVGQTGECNTG
jgi:hypothetical protein